MAQKNATPTKEQQAMLKANGLNPLFWVIVKDLMDSVIVRNRLSGEFKLVSKRPKGK